jgi:hypothetical protein
MAVTNAPRVRRGRLVPWLVAGWLILLVCAFVMNLSFRANQRLADAVAAADRDNPYWRLDELMAHRENVPDAENSALVLAKVDELLPKDWPTVTAPAVGGATSGKSAALDAYDRLQELSPNVRPDERMASVLRAELKAHETALAIARTVADYRRGRHELALAPTLIDTRLAQTQATRRVARLLSAEAALRAEDGDPDAALASCRAILGTARSIGDEPMLVSSLVRIWIDGVALNSTRRLLAQGEPSDPALAQLQALILDEKAQPLLVTAVNGERALTFELIRRVEAGEVRLSTLIGGGIPNKLIAAVPAGLVGQRALALEWMNAAVAISRRSTYEQRALWMEWDTNIAAFHQGGLKQLSALLPLQLVPAMLSANMTFLRSQAELGAMAILIAAERQRRRTGKWPASLKEIHPSVLPEAPMDPFTGKPFHIEHRDGQFFIYSIGPNGKDEHGDYDLKQWPKGGPDDVGAKAWDLNLRRQPPVQSNSPGRPQSQEG